MFSVTTRRENFSKWPICRLIMIDENIPYFVIASVAMYSSLHFLDTISMCSNIAGKLTNNISQGAIYQKSISVGARLFLPPVLIILSLLIEHNISTSLFFLIAAIHTFSAFLTTIISIYKINFYQQIFQRSFFYRQNLTLPVSLFKAVFVSKSKCPKSIEFKNKISFSKTRRKKLYVSIVSYFFLGTGFLLSFAIATVYSEFRMTISQLTSVFHGIGAIILSFYIDPFLSKSIDTVKRNEKWIDNLSSIFFGRLIAYLLATFLFLLLAFNYPNL